MSLTTSLGTALSGLNAAQRGLALTANNIANAQTPGYTRKVLDQENRVVAGQGQGVRTLEAARIVDEFLTREIREQSGKIARAEIVGDVYDRVQASLLGAPGDSQQGLDASLRRLSGALQNLEQSPSSTAARLAATGAVNDAFATLARAGNLVQDIRGDLDGQIAAAVGDINTKLSALEQLNRDITRSGAPGALLDQRDQLIEELSSLLDIDVHFEATGAARIYTGDGSPILGQSASLLSYDRASTVVDATVFGAIRVFEPGSFDPRTQTPVTGAVGDVLVSGGIRRELTPELEADAVPDADQRIVSPLQEGRLEGLLEARDKILPEIHDQVLELTVRLEHGLNAAHNNAVAPQRSSITGTNTDLAAFATTTRSGAAYLSVIDSDGAIASTVAVDLTAADAHDLASQIDTDLGALGAATIDASGALAITLADSGQTLALAPGTGLIEADVAGVTEEFSFSHYFGLNDLVVEDADDGRRAVRPDITDNIGNLSTAWLEVEVGPPITASLGGAGDNRGALALSSSMTAATDFSARGGLPDGRFTPTDYIAEMTGLIATRADQAKQAEATDRAIGDDLEFRRAARSGVNIDEELANLLHYQQSYATAARVLSVTNDLFAELLNIAR